jgi:hypothetical protein
MAKQSSTKRLFWFVSVPIVLAWVAFASLAVWRSVVDGVEITENQLTVIGIVGGPALLIITNVLDLFKQETANDIQNMTPHAEAELKMLAARTDHELARAAAQHDHEMVMEREAKKSIGASRSTPLPSDEE